MEIFRLRHCLSGELILSYNQRMGAQHLDTWSGPFVVQPQLGRSVVKCLNSDTKKIVYIDLNDLRTYQRPDTRELRLADSEIKRISTEIDLYFENFTKGDLNNSWKNTEVFVDISDVADLEMVFVKALKEQPKRILSGRSESFLISHLHFMLTLFVYVTMLMLSLLEMTLWDFASGIVGLVVTS